MRIHNIGRWQEIPVNTVIPFHGGQQRLIKVTFNCPAPTRFDLIEDGVQTFLATLVGLGTVEFEAGGGERVEIHWDGEVPPWFVTHDGRVTSIRYNVEPAKFTKIATRRQRNPDLVRIENIMRLNELKRQQAWEDEQARRRAWEAEQAAANGGNDTTAASEASSTVQQSAAGATETPDEGAATDGAT